jgi:hypothetical protein
MVTRHLRERDTQRHMRGRVSREIAPWCAPAKTPSATGNIPGATIAGRSYHRMTMIRLSAMVALSALAALAPTPALGAPAPIHPLPQPEVGNVAAAGGVVYLLGGTDESGVVDQTSYRYDSAADQWVDIGLPLPNIDRSRVAVTGWGQHIGVVGWDSNGGRWFDHLYDRYPGWLSRDITNAPARPPILADANGHIWFFNTLVRRGSSAVEPAVWEYDFSVERWTRHPDNVPRGLVPAAAARNGRSFYIAGRHRMYRFVDGVWYQAASLPARRFGFAFRHGPDGRIWMMGGFRLTANGHKEASRSV